MEGTRTLATMTALYASERLAAVAQGASQVP
jgi:hypothetical protein